ncbi:MAG: hypothetical protein ACI4VK_04635 [Candidatus Coproplasma sp.]
MQSKESVKDALLKCAVGLSASEIVEEFSADNAGELKLVKRKVTRREVPPDIKAVKMLMDGECSSEVSDEELMQERERLMALLKEDNSGD